MKRKSWMAIVYVLVAVLLAACAYAADSITSDPLEMIPTPWRAYVTAISGLGMFVYVIWRILVHYGIAPIERQIVEPRRSIRTGNYEYQNLFTLFSELSGRLQALDERLQFSEEQRADISRELNGVGRKQTITDREIDEIRKVVDRIEKKLLGTEPPSQE